MRDATEKRRAFRDALAREEILVAPGAYDAITALLVEANGFDAVYVSGAGATNAHLGLPDLALITLTEMAEIVGRITAAVDIPAFSDVDTGYGNALNVVRTVRELERAGAAGLHLEDQVFGKRCGHLEGKQLVGVDEMLGKLAAAQEARRDPEFVLIARTDAAALGGVDEALRRAHAYAEGGADVIFVEALTDPAEFERFARDAPPIPLLANMTEFGKTPILPAAEFQRLGYAAVIFPMTAFRLMLRAVDDGLAELRRTGTQRDLLDRMRTREELYRLVGYDAYEELERRFVPDARGHR